MTGVHAHAVRRKADALVDIAADFERCGYAVVASPFDAGEIKRWRDECERLWAMPGIHDASVFCVDLRDTVHGGRVAERLDPVTDASPLFAALARDERIVRLARLLLNEDVVLFKDKLIMKKPGTMGYPTHQDFSYIAFMGFPGERQLAIAIAVDATNEENGAVEVFAGYHNKLAPTATDDEFLVDEGALNPDSSAMVPLLPGDILVLHSLCPHRSGPNRTDQPRRMMFFTYNGASVGDHYETYYRLGKP